MDLLVHILDAGCSRLFCAALETMSCYGTVVMLESLRQSVVDQWEKGYNPLQRFLVAKEAQGLNGKTKTWEIGRIFRSRYEIGHYRGPLEVEHVLGDTVGFLQWDLTQ
jgi:hypothetical protein